MDVYDGLKIQLDSISEKHPMTENEVVISIGCLRFPAEMILTGVRCRKELIELEGVLLDSETLARALINPSVCLLLLRARPKTHGEARLIGFHAS